MEKVLVTGGAGFIGSHVSEELSGKGYRVYVMDNIDSYYSQEIKRKNLRDIGERVTFIKADITDYPKIKGIVDEIDPDYVIHEAAQAGVIESIKNPHKTDMVNIQGTLNLLEAVRGKKLRKFVFASSSSVYGPVKYLPFDENHPTNPISPYGVSKLACENYLRIYSRMCGLRYVA
ncbi:MAG: SDR family NAD(P)-dependent oxidoreductase, partial [Candidatus Altiarchaeota archaeon]|nr:SDR family NAD(P)-dependent oxidoreductase [Candidatus Altiarchaeota archaeon]